MISQVDAPALVAAGRAAFRRHVPAMRACPTPRLVDSTPSVIQEWVKARHYERNPALIHELGCYEIPLARCAGRGHVTVDGNLVSSGDVIPFYWLLSLSDDGFGEVLSASEMPVRKIPGTGLLVLGHGVNVYGHVLLELLAKLELACAMEASIKWDYILLPTNTPNWVRGILRDFYGITDGRLVYFDPAFEQVELENAILPTAIWANEQFHPYADMVYRYMSNRVPASGLSSPKRRIVMSRDGFFNPAGVQRTLVNEVALNSIACSEFGFEVIRPEQLMWTEQVMLMRECSIIVGAFGSALHNAVFAERGVSVLCYGMMNLVQSEIASFKFQACSYLPVTGPAEAYVCDENEFRHLIASVVQLSS